ncbi:proton-coupled zinc antiporter SLC30A2-like isoform X2 [Littorina saxatilis]|uniref:Zinc transporter 2-like n=1 Tax=Littorina saxatilis TaxID=31220 RepID=A0AAN9ARK7_9CAEN
MAAFNERENGAFKSAESGVQNGIASPTYGNTSLSENDIRSAMLMSSDGLRRSSKPVVTFVVENGNSTTITYDRASTGTGSEDDAEAGERRPLTHCHIKPTEKGVDKKARFKLVLASVLCLVFMIGEVVGGVLAHSLAVVSDAAHLLTDFASFMISLVALYLVSRPATKRLSFGWHRAEILGALVSILMLWVITGVLVYSAVLRIQSGDYEINATIMLITSATGVFFNVVLGCTLHQHGHTHGGLDHGHSHGGHGHDHDHDSESDHAPESYLDYSDNSTLVHQSKHNSNACKDTSQCADESGDKREPTVRGYGSISANERQHEKVSKKAKPKASNINVKAAFIHVVGDFCQSVGVLIAAIIIYFKPEWKMADPICTFLFSVFVLITTITIIRDILMVLMEGTPRNLNFEEVRDTFLNMEGVRDIHDLRLWSLTMNKTALAVHLAVEKGVDPMQVVKIASQEIQHKFNISQTTIQVEEYEEEMNDCTRCQDLKD